MLMGTRSALGRAGIKFRRHYDPHGILEPGGTGKALARKRRGPQPAVVARIVEVEPPSSYSLGRGDDLGRVEE